MLSKVCYHSCLKTKQAFFSFFIQLQYESEFKWGIVYKMTVQWYEQFNTVQSDPIISEYSSSTGIKQLHSINQHNK